MLFALYLRRENEIAGASKDQSPVISMQQAHERLSHPGEEMTRKIAKALGWTLTRGNLKPCEACSAGKANQMNVPQVSEHEVY